MLCTDVLHIARAPHHNSVGAQKQLCEGSIDA